MSDATGPGGGDAVAEGAARATRLADRVSGDSGLVWTEPGAWPVADGVHRIPLPLPMDGLRAVNVYAVESEEGLTLIDGGWSVAEARAALEAGLARLGHGLRDITRFLVTHVHRDHYALATVVAQEVGAQVHLGLPERPTVEVMRRLRDGDEVASPIAESLREAGAHRIAEAWSRRGEAGEHVAALAVPPSHWLDGDVTLRVGSRTLEALHTPGHTAGHYVFADATAGVLFAGDHVLPHITPSVGFEAYPPRSALGDFLGSLARVRALPDRVLLPAHGPVVSSTHARVDELLAHHDHRLALCAAAARPGGSSAYEVAGELPWTSRDTPFAELDDFNQALASMETRHHLEVLLARGALRRTDAEQPGQTAVYAPGRARVESG